MKSIWSGAGGDPAAGEVLSQGMRNRAGTKTNCAARTTTSEGRERKARVQWSRRAPWAGGGRAAVHQKAGEGQQRNQPEMEMNSHSFASELHQVDLVDVECGAGAEDGDDDGQAHSGFRGGDHHDEEDEDLSFDGVPLVGEGHEGEIDGVEHELDGHEDGDEAALDEEADDSKGKQERREDEIPGNRDHRSGLPFSPGRLRRGWR